MKNHRVLAAKKAMREVAKSTRFSTKIRNRKSMMKKQAMKVNGARIRRKYQSQDTNHNDLYDKAMQLATISAVILGAMSIKVPELGHMAIILCLLILGCIVEKKVHLFDQVIEKAKDNNSEENVKSRKSKVSIRRREIPAGTMSKPIILNEGDKTVTLFEFPYKRSES